jgi:hypothetical protein
MIMWYDGGMMLVTILAKTGMPVSDGQGLPSSGWLFSKPVRDRQILASGTQAFQNQALHTKKVSNPE